MYKHSGVGSMFSVPFAVEERSGVITVIDELGKYERPLFEFEAVASHQNVTIVTSAAVHVVDVNDERGVLLKLVFHFILFVNKNLECKNLQTKPCSNWHSLDDVANSSLDFDSTLKSKSLTVKSGSVKV